MADKIGTDEYGEILIYQTDDGQTNIEVKIEDDTVWLTQQQLTELYQCSKSNISEHIKHIFEEGELDKDSVVRKFRTTADDGKTYNVTYYNLDMIISLGYRIKSVIATRFRQWATKRLKEYMIKGFTIDDERLKGNGGGNYWKELLDRIRDIRSSEKVLYRQVLDLYATSVDYNPHSEESVRFFNSQFIISTHSPFLLDLMDARIYDLDSTPVCVKNWLELDNIKEYIEFFKKYI